MKRTTTKKAVFCITFVVCFVNADITDYANNDNPNAILLSPNGQTLSKLRVVDRSINAKLKAARDIDSFAAYNPKGTYSNTDFSKNLYNILTTKYYWRDWFVIVSDVYEEDKIRMHVCDYYRLDNHGRTIGVTSFEKSQSTNIVPDSAFNGVYSMVREGLNGEHHCVHPDVGFNMLPAEIRSQCGSYLAAVSYCNDISVDVSIQAAARRLQHSSFLGQANIIVFS